MQWRSAACRSAVLCEQSNLLSNAPRVSFAVLFCKMQFVLSTAAPWGHTQHILHEIQLALLKLLNSAVVL